MRDTSDSLQFIPFSPPMVKCYPILALGGTSDSLQFVIVELLWLNDPILH